MLSIEEPSGCSLPIGLKRYVKSMTKGVEKSRIIITKCSERAFSLQTHLENEGRPHPETVLPGRMLVKLRPSSQRLPLYSP
jgi:hypothetical protein